MFYVKLGQDLEDTGVEPGRKNWWGLLSFAATEKKQMLSFGTPNKFAFGFGNKTSDSEDFFSPYHVPNLFV
jgi:hypothetical protein